MKKSDIKRAYDSVSSGGELKEKVFARLEMEKKIFTKKEMSYLKLKHGGCHKFTTVAICIAAAMVTAVFLMRHMFP